LLLYSNTYTISWSVLKCWASLQYLFLC
jgi:hypothetical protein